MAFHPFQFLEKNAPKSERERPSTLRDWPPCPPIQRDGGRRSRLGVNPFISVLTVARCPAAFPGVWPQLRDTLSTSRSVGRGTGAFIYALSADETRPALAAPRHASTALFSCRFKSLILSRLVDTFISRISLTMLPVPNPHNTVCVLSWEEARHWQSRSSGYSSS